MSKRSDRALLIDGTNRLQECMAKLELGLAAVQEAAEELKQLAVEQEEALNGQADGIGDSNE